MRDYADDLPVFLELDLYQAGWNGAKHPYPGMTSRQFAMMSLRKSLTKKFVPRDTTRQDLAALELFLKINSECKDYVPTGDIQLTSAESYALDEAKHFIARFCLVHDEQLDLPVPLLNVHSISDNIGFGPGASIGCKTEDFLSKVGSSTMAATSTTLHMYYMQAICNDRVWADVESIRLVSRGTEIVQGSRLAFVPKNAEISRTICTEPLCNMMFQKGIGTVITEQLRRSCGIDLRSQPDKNRTLARLGSVDGKFGTIDLSSASDSMSLGLVREFFPREFVSWLELTRSPVTTLPGGEQVDLHMVSSMGNAYTFPLQTLFFCALVYGAYRALGIRFERPRNLALGNFAVFGDDIIVEKEAYDLLLQLLSICGFKANVDKSFNQGLFRESCGHDYYCGHNVRGVYIQYIRDDCDKYSAINRLNRWSVKHGIVLPNTVSVLRKGIRTLWIPNYEDDSAGIMVPKRSISRPRYDKYTGGVIYRYVTFVSEQIDVRSVEGRQVKLEGWIGNHSSILLAALAGALRAGKVVRRLSGRRLSRVKQRTSSSWDSFSAAWGETPKIDNGWKTIVEINLDLL